MKKIISILSLLLLASSLMLSTLSIVHAQEPGKTIDGDPSDWIGEAPVTENTWTFDQLEFIWNDAVNDDTGNGTFTYPTNPAFTGGDADLTELRIQWNSSLVFFLLTFDDIVELGWGPGEGADTTAVAICIDTDLVEDSGYDVVDDGSLGVAAHILLPSTAYWEYMIEICCSDMVLWYSDGISVYEAVRDFAFAANTTVYETIEFAVPINATNPESGLPDPAGQTWRVFAFIGLQDYDHFREVDGGPPKEWQGGGGSDGWYDPNAYDCAFFSSTAEQEVELNGFIEDNFAVIPAYAELIMNQIFIPEFPFHLLYGFALIFAAVLIASLKMKRLGR